MYTTILTGNVSRENWSPLEQSYAAAIKKCPDGLLQSFLLHAEDHSNLWHIVTIWRNKTAYEKAHHAKLTETCAQLFCDAGSVPQRSTFAVVKCYHNSAEMVSA
jgi:hypothetical protein